MSAQSATVSFRTEESGCLTAGTRILRADTGSEITLGDLLTSGEQNVLVWSLDDRMRLVPRTMTHAFPSGTKEVFRVRLDVRPRGRGNRQPPVPYPRRLASAERH